MYSDIEMARFPLHPHASRERQSFELLLYDYDFTLLGVKQQSCETTIIILRFPIIIIIFLQWEYMAAHGMQWSKVVKFGTLNQDSLRSLTENLLSLAHEL
jgi:hypothetical protein